MTTLFAIDALPAVPATDAPAVANKRGWLPLLTVLFLISYGLMTMLIVEQGRTIESQRALIRELFRDSTELSAAKKNLQDRAQSLSAQTQAADTQTPPSQAQPKPAPSTQTSASPAPSSQGSRQQRAQNQSAKQKPDFKMPSKPEPDLIDDVRTLITI